MSGRDSVAHEGRSPEAGPLGDARRAPAEELRRHVDAAGRSPVVTTLLEASDGAVLVLNAQRQIVASNERAAFVGAPGSLVGLRPGEALACVNARASGDCGVSPACRQCGALGAILGCQGAGRARDAECLLRSELPGHAALEFNVRTTPLDVEGHRFTVMALRDVSAEKRRDALEQLFLHDVLNTVAGLRGWASRLRRGTAAADAAGERIERLSTQLEREIRDHRMLVAAERGRLVITPEPVRAADALSDVAALCGSHPTARDRRLAASPAPADLVVETDRSILLRVLTNMVVNALEATPPGGEVRLACTGDAAGAEFSVHNAGAIAPDVQARIFQRSFSTKAARGRGLGTYGMKLLGERHLGGAVSFASDAERGTTFRLRLSRPPPA